MRSPASEQKERVGKWERGSQRDWQTRVCRLMKTNSICSQLEMKCALELFGAEDLGLCVSVYLAMWELVTGHVCVGVTVGDLVDVEMGVGECWYLVVGM